jgi:deoxyribonuclease-4
MTKIGMHINSNIDTLVSEIHRAHKYGASIIQLFTQPVDNLSVYNSFIEAIKRYQIEVIIHSSYALNIARPLDPYSWQIRYIIQQTQFMHLFDCKYIVLHLGKKLKFEEKEAIKNMLDNIIYLVKNSPNNIVFLIETSSGQGSELCSKLDDLAPFYNRLKGKTNRIGICIDTCHVFQAGWNIGSVDNFTKVMNKFDKLIGISEIKLVHFNNSLNNFGLKKDRHASIENGVIDKKVLYDIAKYFINKQIPIILETPFNEHKKEIHELLKINL